MKELEEIINEVESHPHCTDVREVFERAINQRVIEELDRMDTKIGVEISERIGDLKWRNEVAKGLKQ
tara:strand:- start:2348 stop:2548 length:201 start_codon:yes stop_codon:yes gene_type:complete